MKVKDLIQKLQSLGEERQSVEIFCDIKYVGFGDRQVTLGVWDSLFPPTEASVEFLDFIKICQSVDGDNYAGHYMELVQHIALKKMNTNE